MCRGGEKCFGAQQAEVRYPIIALIDDGVEIGFIRTNDLINVSARDQVAAVCWGDCGDFCGSQLPELRSMANVLEVISKPAELPDCHVFPCKVIVLPHFVDVRKGVGVPAAKERAGGVLQVIGLPGRITHGQLS